MRVWLTIAALLFLAWSGVLLLAPHTVLSPLQAAEYGGLVVASAAANVLCALLAAWSATNPRLRHAGIYSTLLGLLTKWVVDLYGVLEVLPPQQAALTLADLIISVALLVGILESLPRIVGIKGTH